MATVCTPLTWDSTLQSFDATDIAWDQTEICEVAAEVRPPPIDFVVQPQSYQIPRTNIVYLNKRTSRSDADDLKEMTRLYAMWAKQA